MSIFIFQILVRAKLYPIQPQQGSFSSLYPGEATSNRKKPPSARPFILPRLSASQRTGVYSISAFSSVASSLKMTGHSPSLQLQMATPGFLIQSP